MSIEGNSSAGIGEFDDEVRLSGMELTLAMREWMKAKETAFAKKESFVVPRPNSRAYLDMKGAELAKKRADEAQREYEKQEARNKKNPEFFEKVSLRPTEKQVLGMVAIKEEVKKEKKKRVQSVLENPENAKELKEMLSDVYLHRPNPEDFIGVMDGTDFEEEYSPQKVHEDMKSVEVNRTFIDMNNRQFGEYFASKNETGFEAGEILQAIIIDRVNHGWIPEMKGIMTCDFDDLNAGIDSALRYKSAGYFGVSLDMTIAEKVDIVEEKLQKNWDYYITKGHVPVVKYYEDPENPDDKGKRIMPKFVIGGTHEDLNRLAQAYLKHDLESIAEDPLKYTILAQIEVQLEAVLAFYMAEEHSDNRRFDFARKQYLRFRDFFEEIKLSVNYTEKRDLPEYKEHRENNVIYNVCKNFTPKMRSKLVA